MIPLWLPSNETQDSSVFKVCPGTVALLVATGFERFRTRTEAKEFESPQLACIHRLIFDYETVAVGALEPRSACDYLYEITQTLTHVTDEVVWNKRCMWSIGGCDNTKIIAVPGTYYLHLNDASAIGQAQVWIDVYKTADMPIELLKDLLP